MKLWPIIIGAFLTPWALGAIGAIDDPAPVSQIDPEIVEQVKAEQQVRALLRDPDSAEFQHVRSGVCGYVNARNGFGGRIGYQRFLIGDQGAVLEEQADARSFANSWRESCTA